MPEYNLSNLFQQTNISLLQVHRDLERIMQSMQAHQLETGEVETIRETIETLRQQLHDLNDQIALTYQRV